MKPYLFLDLDDTIFQTQRKCPCGNELTVAALSRDGSPLSFMTTQQMALLKLLQETMHVIPATARNYDAYKRVCIDFKQEAVLNYGGVILLSDGSIDVKWDATLRTELIAYSNELFTAKRELDNYVKRNQLDVTVRIINDYDMDLYVVIKHRKSDNKALKRLYNDCVLKIVPKSCYLHFNDNNIAIIPNALNKANAVSYLIKNYYASQYGDIITIGMGDSLSDLKFMGICDFMMTPKTSQISRALL